jgi:hypothetical protein
MPVTCYQVAEFEQVAGQSILAVSTFSLAPPNTNIESLLRAGCTIDKAPRPYRCPLRPDLPLRGRFLRDSCDTCTPSQPSDTDGDRRYQLHVVGMSRFLCPSRGEQWSDYLEAHGDRGSRIQREVWGNSSTVWTHSRGASDRVHRSASCYEECCRYCRCAELPDAGSR